MGNGSFLVNFSIIFTYNPANKYSSLVVTMSQSAPQIEAIQYPFPVKPMPLTELERARYKSSIKQLLKDKDAVSTLAF